MKIIMNIIKMHGTTIKIIPILGLLKVSHWLNSRYIQVTMPQIKNSWLNNCTRSPNLILFLVVAWEIGSFRFPTKTCMWYQKDPRWQCNDMSSLLPVDINICLDGFGAIRFKEQCTCLTCILSSFHTKFNVNSVLQIWTAHFSVRYKHTSLISVKAWTKLMLGYIYIIFNTNFLHNVFISYYSDMFWPQFLAVFREHRSFHIHSQLEQQVSVTWLWDYFIWRMLITDVWTQQITSEST